MTENFRDMVTVSDIEYVTLREQEFQSCVDVALKLCRNMIDRPNLHSRDPMERFNNILMGEVAEKMVIKWFHDNGKYAVSAVDKNSGQPDLGHDIYLKNKESGKNICCSVKSSLSYQFLPEQILERFTLASTRNETRDVNIQVYFWLVLNPTFGSNRVTTLSISNAAIFSWFGSKDLINTGFNSYGTESRQAPDLLLKQGRKMSSLLFLIKDSE